MAPSLFALTKSRQWWKPELLTTDGALQNYLLWTPSTQYLMQMYDEEAGYTSNLLVSSKKSPQSIIAWRLFSQ